MVEELIRGAVAGDYLAILPYLRQTPERHQRLQSLRTTLRDATRLATTLGYGPRYLHSTGQLHKGGPPSGIFLMITAEASCDAPIPGSDHGFATLLEGQALGDLRALADHGRKVMRVHLQGDVDRGLAVLADGLAAAFSQRS
jgi:hypothetical protein